MATSEGGFLYNTDMEPTILYEDQDLLVIDKPSGMVVNRAESVKGKTVEEWAEGKGITGTTSTTGTDFERRRGIVHRLDKETSGVLIITKTLEAFTELQRQFKAREVEKTYIALVHGKVAPAEGVIREPVGRLPWHRERFGVLSGGREAETGYKTIMPNAKCQMSNEVFTLLELSPKTGRTHQLRVHLKSINHPVVGDSLYAGRKTARRDREWCPRLFLHAKKIIFKHPTTGQTVPAEAPIPKELERVIRQLIRQLAD